MTKMNTKQTLLFFGLPGLIITLLFNYAMPVLLENGWPLHWAVFFSVWAPVIALFCGVIFIWKQSQRPLRDYFWLSKVSWKQVLILLAVFIGAQALEGALSFSRALLTQLPGFHVPDYFPEIFKANYELQWPLQSFMGMPVKGNYGLLGFWALWLVVNVIGEELLWRGYALPRMEQYFGKWAWLINGLLWNLFIHFFMRWSFIALLPVSLAVPYFSQKYHSWVPGLIIHGLGNALFFLILIPSVMQ